MKPDINLFKKYEESGMNMKDKITFPLTLTIKLIDKLIKKNESANIPFGMYN